MIKTVLIDDNKQDLEFLANELKDILFIDVVASFYNPIKAIEFVTKTNVQLIISDVKMPQINGINAIKLLSNPPLVIFISSYPQYALQSFDVNPVHYLTKPFSKENLLKAVYRAQFAIQQSAVLSDNFIFVYVNKNYEKIMYADILYIKAEQNYVKIVSTKRNYLVLSNLSQFLKQLPQLQFKRIHKSYAVNIEAIAKYNTNEIIFNDTAIPISEAYKDDILNSLKLNTSKKRN